MDTIKLTFLALVLAVVVPCLLPGLASAQYHGVTQHRVARHTSLGERPGWSQGHGQQHQGVPELDPNAAGAAIALLVGGVVVLRGSRSRVRVSHAA